jgi:hypothetical protein
MELPEDVVRYLREFTRPRTRPNWRQGGRVPSADFYTGLKARYKTTCYKNNIFEKAYARSRMAANPRCHADWRPYMYV